jgi:hypothetical protein
LPQHRALQPSKLGSTGFALLRKAAIDDPNKQSLQAGTRRVNRGFSISLSRIPNPESRISA